MTDSIQIEGTAGQDVFVGRQSRSYLPLMIGGGVLLLLFAGYFAASYVTDFLTADNFFDRSKARTAVVDRGHYERSISVEGNVVAMFAPTLYAEANGVVSLLVEEGDTVIGGQSLASVDNPELVNQLKREVAALRLQEVELETLRNQLEQQELETRQALDLIQINLDAEQRELERRTVIVGEGAIALNEFEKNKDRVHSLEVQVKNTTTQLGLTRANNALAIRTKSLTIDQQALVVEDLERKVALLTLTSPVNGTVGEIMVKERDTVQADQPMINVVDLSSYEVEVLIPETYAESLDVGLTVQVVYRNQNHEARLASISPQVRDGSVSGRVVFAGESPAGLRQNLRLNNKIILETKDDVIKVKRGPFVESHGGRGVYVLDGDIAQYRRIQLGSIGISEVEVISGLTKGEQVIISDTSELMGSDRVLITN
ncbi:MAG: HlyD family efflux transporter periplasmic adaptor subunit [Pseudomonadota bacterium]